jgi:hypothetical protein
MYTDVVIVGKNLHYPNCMMYTNGKYVSPYDEEIMSLKKTSFADDSVKVTERDRIKIQTPMFFFCYNFDNYFHFIYDTLPYIIDYRKLKSEVPTLKLLVNYPNPTMTNFYKFNNEIFTLLGLTDDLHIISDDEIYNIVYTSSSHTRGNKPPNPMIYSLYKGIQTYPDKIYISRRTHLISDKSNIGTDYTMRRIMVNEDELVSKLCSIGFTEIFCESMDMSDKINMFKNVKHVVGPIGGGMCNLLFSPSDTNVHCIVSPYFMEINNRLKYSMEHTNIAYFTDTKCVSELYRRAVIPDGRIGEVIDISDGNYTLNVSNNDVAGFNQNVNFVKQVYTKSQLNFLDDGLNSPYECNIKELLTLL